MPGNEEANLEELWKEIQEEYKKAQTRNKFNQLGKNMYKQAAKEAHPQPTDPGILEVLRQQTVHSMPLGSSNTSREMVLHITLEQQHSNAQFSITDFRYYEVTGIQLSHHETINQTCHTPCDLH
eukprot:2227798-Amphidinium_carterae.2